jgi:hypothetical protein
LGGRNRAGLDGSICKHMTLLFPVTFQATGSGAIGLSNIGPHPAVSTATAINRFIYSPHSTQASSTRSVCVTIQARRPKVNAATRTAVSRFITAVYTRLSRPTGAL